MDKPIVSWLRGEAARALRVSSPTITAFVKAGLLAYTRDEDGRLIFDRDDVLELARTREQARLLRAGSHAETDSAPAGDQR